MLARAGTGEELVGSARGSGAFWRLSTLSMKDLRLAVLAPPESSTLLLDRAKMLRPVLNPSSFTLRRFDFDVGHSALQLTDRLSPEESRLFVPDAGVRGDDERRFCKRGGGSSAFPFNVLFPT